jgi:hypothetical protein
MRDALDRRRDCGSVMSRRIRPSDPVALHITTTPEQLAFWKKRATDSGVTLKEWVTYSLNAAPQLERVLRPREEPFVKGP